MDNAYDLFSNYYRELIYSSGHFENEVKTITKIAGEHCGNVDCKILDAACGTGDALNILHKLGYRNIEGLDGSLEMIERARHILPHYNLHNIKWEDLHESTICYKQYDLIFLISMSLAHAQENDIDSILKSFYNMLSPNGTLVFDNRPWRVKQDFLFENNRPVNAYNNPRKVVVNQRSWIIDDKCEYTEGKQKITYRIKDENNKQEEVIYIPLYYSKILTSKYLELLNKIGFRKCYSHQVSDWPYELLYSTK